MLAKIPKILDASKTMCVLSSSKPATDAHFEHMVLMVTSFSSVKEGNAPGVAHPPCVFFDFASLHVGRGIDMGSRHDDFLM